MSAICSHGSTIRVTELPEKIEGCVDCLATGGAWVHRRMYQPFGRIECGDSSPCRHASAHAGHTGHPIARSADPGGTGSGATSTMSRSCSPRSEPVGRRPAQDMRLEQIGGTDGHD
jgi:hypothetical protein